jgi:lipopolysaccharide biosynthesis glycosyltransferase
MGKKNDNLFIWTEAFNCGELLNPFLKSYLMHNDYPIFVYGFKSDLEKITVVNSLIQKVDLSRVFLKNKNIESQIRDGYKQGHLGTATLWAFLIKSRIEKHFVHLDADNIFLDDVISDFENVTDQ